MSVSRILSGQVKRAGSVAKNEQFVAEHVDAALQPDDQFCMEIAKLTRTLKRLAQLLVQL